MATHQFWDKQPVTKKTDFVKSESRITPNVHEDKPVKLPENYVWVHVNLPDLTGFLNTYSYSKVGSAIKSYFTQDYMEWMYPETTSTIIGIRLKDGTLIGCIAASCNTIILNKNTLKVARISNLCLHPKFRGQRLSSLLIRELKRQLNNKNISEFVFESSKMPHTPVVPLKFYDRSLNTKKIYKLGIVQLGKDVDYVQYENELFLPKEPIFEPPAEYPKNAVAMVEMKNEHIDAAYNLLCNYLKRYNFTEVFTRDEFVRRFYNNNVVKSYVVLNANNNVIDFASYYITMLKFKDSDYLSRGMVYYYTSTTETAYRLLYNLLVIAKNNNVDMFGAYNNMENNDVLTELNFSSDQKTSNTSVFVYNWYCRTLVPKQVGYCV